MIDHLSLGVHDLTRSIAFYERTFAPLGFTLQHANEKEASFGPGTSATFWLYPSPNVTAMPGLHVAFAATTKHAVDEAHVAATSNGGTSAREPGRRPDISEEYYGAVVLDPDGHRLELVCYC